MNVRALTRYGFATAFASVLMMSAAPALAAQTYTCYRYVDGKPAGGHLKISASSKEEATRTALDRYRNKLKKRVDSVNCKVELF